MTNTEIVTGLKAIKKDVAKNSRREAISKLDLMLSMIEAGDEKTASAPGTE